MLPVQEFWDKLPNVEHDLRQVEALSSPVERALVALVVPVLDTDKACAAAKKIAEAIPGCAPRSWMEAVARDLPRKLTRSPVFSTVRRFLLWCADSRPPAHEVLASKPSPEQLTELSGLSPLPAARVALFAASCPLLPLDTPIARICVRHGWVDWPLPEAQPWLSLEGLDWRACLRLYFGMRSIARTHCKTRSPLCETCALGSLLPESGPYEPDFAV